MHRKKKFFFCKIFHPFIFLFLFKRLYFVCCLFVCMAIGNKRFYYDGNNNAPIGCYVTFTISAIHLLLLLNDVGAFDYHHHHHHRHYYYFTCQFLARLFFAVFVFVFVYNSINRIAFCGGCFCVSVSVFRYFRSRIRRNRFRFNFSQL